MCIDCRHRHRSCQGGLTLIELILFIVIVGVALAGSLAVFNTATRASADPLVRKQMLAAAESLLEEVILQPFTFCDPNDANVATANSPAVGVGGCATTSEDTALGPEGEVRYGTGATLVFDNVSDYHGLGMTGTITNALNNPVLTGYDASIAIADAGAAFGVTSGDALRIAVTVTRGGESVTLTGYRLRHSPNAGG